MAQRSVQSVANNPIVFRNQNPHALLSVNTVRKDFVSHYL
ncbi:hypothetical protein PROAA_2930006 [Candidatus Propionivibrio aalborgensis]|uniref:Uncharacterized protein n=1 Tax=Candidatus Propionivibrio aalborgensis TaxID=1860101 RepID=A0A1A8XXX5_9RHOO|nr:hypothetical protein PROAA_2930006 [Candidatus Propionivibrio aalborgensis]